jgi:nitrate reductase NapAB chaperone NapD
MLRYPISTLLYLAKINIKDKIQDALKLHNNIDIRIEAKVIDKNGKIIKVHKQKSHSFLMNYLSMLANLMLNPYGSMNNYFYFLSTANTWWSYAPNYTIATNALTILDGANDSTYGIVVGSGTSTPTPQDYNLQSQIQNGTGSGQLVYSAHTVSPTPGTGGIAGSTTEPSTGVLPVSNKTTSFQVSRQFTNQSGASITVSEVGIIVKATLNNNNTEYVLIIHDLLSSAVTVPNLSILQITYTISVTT